MPVCKFTTLVFVFCLTLYYSCATTNSNNTETKPVHTEHIKQASEEFLNGKIFNETHPFRTKKANLIWRTAKEYAGSRRMGKVYSALLKHDLESLHVKGVVRAGLDKDGSLRRLHKEKLMKILKKYHMGDVFAEEWLNDVGVEENEVLEELPELAGHQKLNELYIKARDRGFTEVELQALREELGHHKERITKWDQLIANLQKEKGSENKLDGKPNEIDDSNTKKWQQLLEEHGRIQQEYDTLNHRVNNRSAGEHFVEARVEELWSLAQSANFSDIELVSLKEELGHFDKRVREQRVMTDDARAAEVKAKQLDQDERDHPEAEHKQMWHRVLDYSSKVRQTYDEFKERIKTQTNRHGGEL